MWPSSEVWSWAGPVLSLGIVNVQRLANFESSIPIRVVINKIDDGWLIILVKNNKLFGKKDFELKIMSSKIYIEYLNPQISQQFNT